MTPTAAKSSSGLKAVAIITSLGGLALGALVVLRPNVVYTPVAKVTLYMLIAILPATVLSTTAASAKLKVEWPGFVATAGGTAAIFFIAFILMNKYSAPDVKLAVYRVKGAGTNTEITLEAQDQVQVSGAPVRYCVDRDQLFIEFPEQVESATLRVRYPPGKSNGVVYEGSIGYAGVRNYTLTLGKDLVAP